MGHDAALSDCGEKRSSGRARWLADAVDAADLPDHRFAEAAMGGGQNHSFRLANAALACP